VIVGSSSAAPSLKASPLASVMRLSLLTLVLWPVVANAASQATCGSAVCEALAT